MPRPSLRTLAGFALALAAAAPSPGHAQSVEDGSEAGIGARDTRVVLDLIGRSLASPDAKVTELRRVAGGLICGSVNVKNRAGLYAGERGFLVDPTAGTFGRVPDGPELLSPKAHGFDEQERIRRAYFDACL